MRKSKSKKALAALSWAKRGGTIKDELLETARRNPYSRERGKTQARSAAPALSVYTRSTAGGAP